MKDNPAEVEARVREAIQPFPRPAVFAALLNIMAGELVEAGITDIESLDAYLNVHVAGLVGRVRAITAERAILLAETKKLPHEPRTALSSNDWCAQGALRENRSSNGEA